MRIRAAGVYLFFEDLFFEDLFLEDFLGTLAPSLRASDSGIPGKNPRNLRIY